MGYTRFFNPPKEWRVGDAATDESIDRRDGSVYYFHHDDIVLAVNVALVTGRPLFLQAPPAPANRRWRGPLPAT